MGKSSPSPPPAPDPVATANAQAAANKETAIAQSQLNMVNQYTPGGSLEYAQRGTSADGIPQYSVTQKLSPEQQAIYDLTNQASKKYGQTANNQLDQVSQTLSSPLDISSIGPVPTADNDAWQRAYDSIIQRNQPQADQQRSILETQLANQGIGYGSEAYNSAMDNFYRSQNDFSLAAQNAALGQQAQQFGMANTAYNQNLNNLITSRQMPLNELAAMMSGTQVQPPNFVNSPQSQINPADVMGATYASYNGQLNNYNAQQAQNAANTQGLFGLLGAGASAYAANPFAFSFSDFRLKKNVELVYRDPRGFGVYDFDYVWGGGRHRGVMAQEVAKVIPSAVAMHESGFLMVNYGEVIT
jgi:hypothetical protein